VGHRAAKIETVIKQEISNIFLYKLQDPAFGFLTITNVKVTADIKIAKIYVSVFEKERRDAVLEKLGELNGYIRSELASRIRIKYIPELQFYIDDTQDHVERINGLLKKIQRNDSEEES
jgi:ribosome-binding factor A